MNEEIRPERMLPRGEQARIEFGLVEEKDIPVAAKLYVDNFPQRAQKWFPNKSQATRFYCDLIELMRLAHGKTFFAARRDGQLIGYFIVTMPKANLPGALFREGFVLRIARHALTGQYGFSLSVLRRALQALLTVPSSSMESQLSDSPHAYILAVERDYAYRGVIFYALVELARSVIRQQFRKMWFCVDLDNVTVVRFYERIGFRILESNPSQYVMVCDLSPLG